MKSLHLLLLSICFVLIFSSCKKTAGVGGTSSIKGRVYAKYYDKSFFVLTDSAYAPNIEVYIIYGNDATYGNNQKTSYDGTYEFKYLQTGSYKIYAYSRDSSGYYLHQVNIAAPKVSVIKNAEITKAYQAVQVSDINIVN